MADAATKLKAATDSAVALKAAAEKAVAEMNPTPDMVKAIEAATAAAKQGTDAAGLKNSVVAKLTAEKARPVAVPAAQ